MKRRKKEAFFGLAPPEGTGYRFTDASSHLFVAMAAAFAVSLAAGDPPKHEEKAAEKHPHAKSTVASPEKAAQENNQAAEHAKGELSAEAQKAAVNNNEEKAHEAEDKKGHEAKATPTPSPTPGSDEPESEQAHYKE